MAIFNSYVKLPEGLGKLFGKILETYRNNLVIHDQSLPTPPNDKHLEEFLVLGCEASP